MNLRSSLIRQLSLGMLIACLFSTLAGMAYGVAFKARQDFRVGEHSQVSAIGDFNADGFQDLAVLEGGTRLQVLVGDMYGRFRKGFAQDLPFPVQPLAAAIPLSDRLGTALAFLNRDEASALFLIPADGIHFEVRNAQLPDAITEKLNSWVLLIQEEDAYRLAALGESKQTIWLIDLNYDGMQMEVIASQKLLTPLAEMIAIGPSKSGRLATLMADGQQISILKWADTGELQEEQAIALKDPVSAIAAGEGAEGVKLFASMASGGWLLEFSSELDNGFSAPLRLPLAGACDSLFAMDANRDGRIDLAYKTAGRAFASISLADEKGRYGAPSFALDPIYHELQSADVNGDQHADLVAIGPDGWDYAVLAGDGAGSFRSSSRLSATRPVTGKVEAKDLNKPSAAAIEFVRNGVQQWLVLDRNGERVEVLSADGKEPIYLAVGDKPSAALATDLNSDGLTDLVVANEASGNVAVLLATSEGWADPIFLGAEEGPISLTAGDFNEDGRPDIAVLNLASGSVSVLTQEILVAIPFGFIDAPATGSSVAGNVTVAGWAAAGVPLTNVALLVDGAVAVPVITLNIPRPDVCAVLAGFYPCPNAGFSFQFNTESLSVGAHTLTLRIMDSNGTVGTGLNAISINKVAVNIQGNLEVPSAGATFMGPFSVVGWTIANRGVAAVDVLVDGALIGTATYGGVRPDVCAAYPGAAGCGTSGFNYTLNPTSLAVGPHSLQIRTRDTGGATFLFPAPPRTFIKAQPVIIGSLELPTGTPPAGTTMMYIRGWAVASVGVARVEVIVDGVKLVNAVYGGARADVCPLVGTFPDCPNVEFSYDLSLTTSSISAESSARGRYLTAGSHTLQIRIVDGNGNSQTLPAAGPIAFNVVQLIINAVVESPYAGETLGSVWTFRGWAGSSDPLTTGQLIIDGQSVGLVNLKSASRPDVCAVYPFADCPNVGWQLQFNTADGGGIATTTTTVAGTTTTTTSSGTTTTTVAGGAPVIVWVEPHATWVGEKRLTVQITGSNFVDGSRAKLDDKFLVTRFVNSGQLSADIPDSELLVSRSNTFITVVNPNGLVSNAFHFRVISPGPIGIGSGERFFPGNGRLELANGTHTVAIAITDNKGRLFSSNPVTFNVNNPTATTTTTTTVAGGTTTTTISPNAPVIYELNPTSIAAGSPFFLLSVWGSKFTSQSVITFAGATLTTNYSSATLLSAIVPASSVTTPGHKTVTVVNPGSIVSNPVDFLVTGSAVTTTTVSGATTTTAAGGTTTTTAYNPNAPTIMDINPTSVPVNSPATIIAVYGYRFESTSLVRFNGTSLFITSRDLGAAYKTLYARIEASMLTSPGAYNIDVVNPGGSVNPGTSNAVIFQVTVGGATVTSTTTTTTTSTTTTTTVVGTTTTTTAGSGTTTTTSGGGTTTTVSGGTTTTWVMFQPIGVEPINVCAGFAATFRVWGSGLRPGLQMQIMGLASNLFPCSVANGESATCSLSANDLGPGNLMAPPPIVATIFLIQEGNVEPFNGFFVWISACM